MTALARLDIEKLAKVAAMFSSPFDGERAVAAALADRMVRAAGLTWPDLLVPVSTEKFGRPNNLLTPGEMLARHGDVLTDWEKQFLASIIRRPSPLSARQSAIVTELRARCAGCAR
jgi:hypothetical protein